MDKALIPLIVCFWALAGCHSRHAAPKEGTGAVPGESVRKDSLAVITDLDPSMVSLKSGSRVSVIDLLSQVWKLEDADRGHWNELFWDSVADARIYPELALYSDLTVTENARCKIRMGKWQLNKEKRELVLRFAGGVSKTYTIRQVALKQMEIGWGRGGDTAVVKLSAGALVHKRLVEDPFYPANNQWREKPRTPETDAQIRRRVKGCAHFFALFFLDNHLRQETDIVFTGLPSCFTWYNGGIGMQDKLDLDKKWVDCFYSESQAKKGYEMLADILGSHTLKWPEHPTSWVQQTGEVLEQMAGKL